MADMNVSEFYPCDRNESVPEQTFELSSLGYIFLDLFVGVFISFGNILVMMAFCKFRELRTSMNVFVVGLALTDLAVALIAIPFVITLIIFPVLNTVCFICMLRYCIVLMTTGSSSILLIVISIDRYLAIEKPFEYSRIMTTDKAKLISFGVFAFTLLYSFLPVFGWNTWSPCVECVLPLVCPHSYLIVIAVCIAIGVVFVGILNIKIFFTANKVSREIHDRMVSFPGQTSTVNRTDPIINKKAIKSLFMMFSAYTICIVPFGVYILLEIHSVDKTGRQLLALKASSSYLMFINSGLNPLIYHRRIPEFNSAVRRILGIKAKVPSGNINNASTHP